MGAQKQEMEPKILSGYFVGRWIKHSGVKLVGLEPAFFCQ